MTRHRCVRYVCAAIGCTFLALAMQSESRAAISYSVINSVKTETFDSLPSSPVNTSLINSGQEWQDDTSTPAAGYVSIPGWYLYHVVGSRRWNA